MRRLLASGMLAAIVFSFATAPLASGAAPTGCPLAPGGGAPQLVTGMDGGACEHTDAGPCVAALGCVTVAPAIRPAAVPLVTPPGLIVVRTASTPRGGDIYQAGPPTPPPNHI